jgi:ribosomal protein S18 acetylase RimI-like enzyme
MVTVRAATAADAEAVAALAQVLAAFEGGSSLCSAQAVTRMLAGETGVGCRILVAEDAAGVVCGFAFFYPGYDLSTDTTGFHLGDICVALHARRSGAGRALMRAVAAAAQAEGFGWVSLTVLSGNQDARAFYEGLGFTDVPVNMYAIGEKGMARWS